MDTFAYTLTPGTPFPWKGEGIMLTLKIVAAEGNGRLLCQPGGMDESHPICIFKGATTLAVDLPFCEAVTFEAQGCKLYISGTVEQFEDEEGMSDFEEEEEAPGLILDSDMTDGSTAEVSDDDSDEEAEDEQASNVVIEEVTDDSEEAGVKKSEPAESKPAESMSEIVESKAESAKPSESKPAESKSPAKQSKLAKTESVKMPPPPAKEVQVIPDDVSSTEAAPVKGSVKGAPLKDKIIKTGKGVTKSAKAEKKAEGKKPAEVKKEDPKADLKNKVEKAKTVGVKKTVAGGVTYEVLQAGNAAKGVAAPGADLSIKYRGTFKDGKQFDAGSLSFKMGGQNVIKGLELGMESMMVGEKRRIFVPASQGYGSRRTGPIPPNTDLIFEVVLREVKNNKKRR